jgi:hypothetical protein
MKDRRSVGSRLQIISGDDGNCHLWQRECHHCKECNSPDDGLPLYRFDVPLPFFALTILRRYISMSVTLVTLVN